MAHRGLGRFFRRHGPDQLPGRRHDPGRHSCVGEAPHPLADGVPAGPQWAVAGAGERARDLLGHHHPRPVDRADGRGIRHRPRSPGRDLSRQSRTGIPDAAGRPESLPVIVAIQPAADEPVSAHPAVPRHHRCGCPADHLYAVDVAGRAEAAGQALG